MGKEDEGYEVRDRRRFDAEGNPREEAGERTESLKKPEPEGRSGQ